METVEIKLPADLVRAAGLDVANPSTEASLLLALELYRENRISLGRAAELCQTPLEQFLEFAGRHELPLHPGFVDRAGTPPNASSPGKASGTIFEQGLGLFGSPEDAALLDDVVSIAYEERRRPTKPLPAL